MLKASTLADDLDRELSERNIERWHSIAFVYRHDISNALRGVSDLTTELAASRASEAKLREALAYCVESTFSHWTIARDVARAALGL